MTKWFDTNYHYLVPELGPETGFALSSTKPLDEFREALGLGIVTRPVLIGPVTYLLLAKATVPGFRTLELLPVAARCLRRAAPATGRRRRPLGPARRTLSRNRSRRRGPHAPSLSPTTTLTAGRAPRVLVATYFSGLGDNLELAASLPVAGLHVDLVRDGRQLPARCSTVSTPTPSSRPASSTAATSGATTSAGPSGCSVRPTSASATASGWHRPARSSTSPTTSTPRPDCRAELRGWLAFARQKLDETALRHPRSRRTAPVPWPMPWPTSDRAAAARRASPRLRRPEVRRRVEALSPADGVRHATLEERRVIQRRALGPYRCCPPPPSARSRRRRPSAPPGPVTVGGAHRRRLPTVLPQRDRTGHPPPGATRTRRPRPRRARAQRHGPVLRRAARRLRLHPSRLGAELRHPLRPAPHPLRRRRRVPPPSPSRGRITPSHSPPHR